MTAERFLLSQDGFIVSCRFLNESGLSSDRWYNEPMPLTLMKRRKKTKKKKVYGWQLTCFLIVLLIGLFSAMWALFVSGPARVHEEKQKQTFEVIRSQVPEIQGLEENVFEYITYQGYTADTLYWFDQTGQIITSRGLDTLDYNKARQTALDDYGIDAQSVELAFGYTSPVYEIQAENTLLMLNYDTLEKVYER